MEAGIAAMLPGNRLTDVSYAIEAETHAAEPRFDRKVRHRRWLRRARHRPQNAHGPFLPNEGAPAAGPTWPGFGAGHRTDAHASHHEDRCVWRTNGPWSPPTFRAAHWEHTVAVTETGRESSPCSTDL
jgi:methionyl aminopeptidase